MTESPLTLSPITANTAIGVMAAYGLLRVLHNRGLGVRLGWDEVSLQAQIYGIDRAGLLEALEDHMRGRDQSPELHWWDSLKKVPVEEYRDRMRHADREAQAWFAAFLCETGDKWAASTVFDLTAGKLKFFPALRNIAGHIAAKGREVWDEVLFGSWRYDDDFASFGWNPTELKDAASYAGNKAPTNGAHRSVVGANWLAYESLPLWPMLGSRTIGQTRRGWSWAICTGPLSLEALAALNLAAPALSDAQCRAMKLQRWKADIYRNGAMGYLGPARTWSDRENPGRFARGGIGNTNIDLSSTNVLIA